LIGLEIKEAQIRDFPYYRIKATYKTIKHLSLEYLFCLNNISFYPPTLIESK